MDFILYYVLVSTPKFSTKLFKKDIFWFKISNKNKNKHLCYN